MKRLLLHSCCGPCSTAVLERLLNETDYYIDVYYYNPNIYPDEEYTHRKNEQIKYIKLLNNERVSFIDADYNPKDYYDAIKGNEVGSEGGPRCYYCFKLRLTKTAEYAKNHKYDIFGTTLTVSPHKNAQVINALGEEISKDQVISFLVADFKKKDGFKRSIILSKTYDLYRQDYCGCIYSKDFSNKLLIK